LSEQIEKKPEKPMNTGPGYFDVILIALIMATGAIFGYDMFIAQKIMVMDLKGYIRTQKALLAAGEVNKEQWETSLDSVEEVLNIKAANRNHIIILKEVVLRNGEEISIK
jgi:hypothetical protein